MTLKLFENRDRLNPLLRFNCVKARVSETSRGHRLPIFFAIPSEHYWDAEMI